MKPISSPDRHVSLDTLRGLALAGVLLVNLLTLFRVSLFSHIAGTDASAEPAGRLREKRNPEKREQIDEENSGECEAAQSIERDVTVR